MLNSEQKLDNTSSNTDLTAASRFSDQQFEVGKLPKRISEAENENLAEKIEHIKSTLTTNSLSTSNSAATKPPVTLNLPEMPDFDSTTNQRIYRNIVGLNFKVFIANTIRFGLSAAAVITFTPFLITQAPIAGTLAAVFTALLIFRDENARGHLSNLHLLNDLDPDADSEPYKKADKLVSSLAERMNLPKPKLAISNNSKLNAACPAFLVDNILDEDLLMLSKPIVNNCKVESLTALVAHELSHSNRMTNATERIANYLTKSAICCIVFAAFGLSQPFLALGFLVTTNAFAKILGNYISIQNEIKTDLRAITVTKDPAAYINMLDYFSGHAEPAFQIYYSHPLLKSRIKLIRQIFSTALTTPQLAGNIAPQVQCKS